ncbi:MAG: tRNA (guanine46-N7-)-methyltransferase (EC [uncultured Sulfurovum sp.]|uniref:tRNA (guanine-N(7)-)-methyltransferase n=1 Tax=uncultured Sulfurovum sp. TaxID=269237 RepID=A0A6S6T6F2_9BACT|nr:MAG: tRNA (guanine46-N7-)-methyltransferase (EC [uncultured Sulfurovum sp.]
MPHITVKPFDTACLKKGKYGKLQGTEVLFKAKDSFSSDELIAIKHENESFLLHLKKPLEEKPSSNTWLLKYDKVTRPLKVNLLKQAIADVSTGLNLDVLQSNITIHDTKVALSNKYEKSIEDFVDIEFPFESVAIEVGFGSGKHLLYQAQKNPERLFIGIEIHTPSAAQVLKQIQILDLKNIWVVNYDARLLLEMIPSNLCHQIFVHFPVPWDKKPQRRVISASFLEESMRVLAKGGRLELRTDSYKYFWYSMETFLGETVTKTAVEVRKNEALEVTSKYEARWLRQEKDIYDVYVTSIKKSESRRLDFNFSFGDIVYTKEILDKISYQAKIFDGFFIHFERLFQIDNDAILIKLAFGSFDRPEHKYIYLDKSTAYYFNTSPVKTMTNYKTHLKIMEYLNV